MPRRKVLAADETLEKPRGITAISVSGFKSIREKQSIDIRPLTILAGANSSGKSSMMQPLLLMKQTLEAPFDPGIFLLDGPNVKFTSTGQLFSRDRDTIEIELHLGASYRLAVTYGQTEKLPGIDLLELSVGLPLAGVKIRTHENMSNEAFQNQMQPIVEKQQELMNLAESYIVKNRCFVWVTGIELDILQFFSTTVPPERKALVRFALPIFSTMEALQQSVHLPGLRGNPERQYPRTGAGPSFPGTFSPYVASIVHKWQEHEKEKLELLGEALDHLGLTWKVEARPIKDAHLELHVARTKKRSKISQRDMVNIADVGLGVSQALPVAVALLAAKPNQIVYIEQPEIHLHPRAQVAMARILADAAKRGVRVVAETHSALLLLGIQTLVAQGELSPDLVKLHWFSLDKEGFTKITSSDLDEAGRFDTDWPEDFAAVELETQSRYLDESEKRLAGS